MHHAETPGCPATARISLRTGGAVSSSSSQYYFLVEIPAPSVHNHDLLTQGDREVAPKSSPIVENIFLRKVRAAV